MPEDVSAGVKPRVEVDGQPLAPEVEVLLEQVVVDDHLHLPDMFLLSFRDAGHTVAKQAQLHIGSRVKISVAGSGGGGAEVLIEGEVTAMEAGPAGVATTAPTACTAAGSRRRIRTSRTRTSRGRSPAGPACRPGPSTTRRPRTTTSPRSTSRTGTS